MNGLPDSLDFRRPTVFRVRLLTVFSVWLVFFSLVNAENIVYVDIARSGVSTHYVTIRYHSRGRILIVYLIAV